MLSKDLGESLPMIRANFYFIFLIVRLSPFYFHFRTRRNSLKQVTDFYCDCWFIFKRILNLSLFLKIKKGECSILKVFAYFRISCPKTRTCVMEMCYKHDFINYVWNSVQLIPRYCVIFVSVHPNAAKAFPGKSTKRDRKYPCAMHVFFWKRKWRQKLAGKTSAGKEGALRSEANLGGWDANFRLF